MSCDVDEVVVVVVVVVVVAAVVVVFLAAASLKHQSCGKQSVWQEPQFAFATIRLPPKCFVHPGALVHGVKAAAPARWRYSAARRPQKTPELPVEGPERADPRN